MISFQTINNPETDFYDYPLAFSRNQINTVTAITEDKDGYLWIGTWGNGLIKFDRNKETEVHFYSGLNNSPQFKFKQSSRYYFRTKMMKYGLLHLAVV